MSEIWCFDYVKGWIEEGNFIDEYINLNDESDLGKVISALGYRNGMGIYQIEDLTLGNPIQLFELNMNLDSALPKFLVEFCPTGGDVTYFTARNMPSLIELLNKLAPLVQATVVCNRINEKYSDELS